MTKNDDGMTNSVVPDQTAPQEQPGLGLHCLLDISVPILGFLQYGYYLLVRLNF